MDSGRLLANSIVQFLDTTIGDRLPHGRPSVISEGTTAPTRNHSMIELQADSTKAKIWVSGSQAPEYASRKHKK
jgi:hypothetical protein